MKYTWILLTFFLFACNSSSNTDTKGAGEEQEYTSTPKANIAEVTAQGSNGKYTFYVTVKSDETGCNQYADWWEVLSSDGELIHRRVLLHSHPDDQPFTRAGSPVNIQDNDIVYIRAHMNKTGYEGDVFKGSISDGFLKASSVPEFSDSIETQEPLPNGCAF